MSNEEILNLSPDQLKILEQEIAIREEALKLKDGLPHLYGMKYYRWQRRFLSSRRRYNTLVANNQSGKSSINIIKCITWATDRELWKRLWKKTPTQFWYLYPDGQTATQEFENKWKVEFLPKEELKEHPEYGWKSKLKDGEIQYIRFNTGVTVYFKTYGQNVHSLQAGSCYAIFADEEVPFALIPELQMRTQATDGYMHFVFTATRGQEEWRRIVEERGKDEMWPEGDVDILKQQVSAYDCLYYEDGTPSTVWTVEKIEQAKKFLHTDAQIQRRIYGKFVKDDGLKYSSFVRAQHVIEYERIDLSKGRIFAGIDYGSGTNHQSSICMVWTNKECTYGVVFDIWVGEKGIPTTAGDVVAKYRSLLDKYKLKKEQVQAFYDWSAADLKTIAQSSGLYFEKADKSHATGERILNTIFKNNMFKIMQNGEWDQLVKQLETLTGDEKKKDAWDDACFVAGTKVLTINGYIPIEKITVGDMVFTRNGFRPVTALMNRPAEVSEYTLQNGQKITCTDNHKFYVGVRGFIPISNIDKSDTLTEFEKCQKLKQLYFKESHSEDTLNPIDLNIEDTSHQVDIKEKRALRHSIKKSGSFITEKYQKGITSIIKMGIHQITLSKILNASKHLSTFLRTLKKHLLRIKTFNFSTFKTSGTSLKSGTAQKSEKSGIPNTVRSHGKTDLKKSTFANSVQSHISQGFQAPSSAQASVELQIEDGLVSTTYQNLARSAADYSQRTDTQKQKPAHRPAQNPLERKQLGIKQVYNITVDHEHEYFVEGVLVANCDAARYAVTKVPWTYVDLKDKPQSIPRAKQAISRHEHKETKPTDSYEEDIHEWSDYFEFTDYGY